MYSLSFPSRPLLSFMASPPCHWWPPALARGVFRLNQPARRVSRAITGGEKVDQSGKLDRKLLISSVNERSAITQGMKNIETRGTTKQFIACYGDSRPSNGEDERRTSVNAINGDKDDCRTTFAVIDVVAGKHDARGNIVDTSLCEEDRSTIVTDDDKEDAAAKRKGDASFNAPIAKIYVDGGSVELYGYIAARDGLDPLLNYIVNVSRDDPIIVEQDSLINMAGPKRGIDLCGTTLIEYDMRIKTGEQETDDLQLIDGVSDIDGVALWDRCTFTNRIHGDYGAVDLTASCLEQAVEASVEVVISEAHNTFSLCLLCFIRGLNEELQLFDGRIGEPRGLKRSVVAVIEDSWIDLKFKIGAESSSSAERCCSFKADSHGRATQEIKTGFGLISVKVTWSTLNL